MNQLNAEQIKLLPKDIQAQVKAGFRHSDLTLTGEAHRALMGIMATERAKELTALANAIITKVEQK